MSIAHRALPCLLSCSIATLASAQLPASDWPQGRRDAARTGRSDEPGVSDPALLWSVPTGAPLAGEPVVYGCSAYIVSGAGEVQAWNAHDGANQWLAPPGYNIAGSGVRCHLARDDAQTLYAGLPADPAITPLWSALHTLRAAIEQYQVSNGFAPPGPDLAPDLVPTYLPAMPFNPLQVRPIALAATPLPGDYNYQRHATDLWRFDLGLWWTDTSYQASASECGAPAAWTRSPEQGGRDDALTAATGTLQWDDRSANPGTIVVPSLTGAGVVWAASEVSNRASSLLHGRLRVTDTAGTLRWEARRWAPPRGGVAETSAGDLVHARGPSRFAAILNAIVRTIGTAVESYGVDNAYYPGSADPTPHLVPTYVACLPEHALWERPVRHSPSPSPGDFEYVVSPAQDSFEVYLWDDDGNRTAVWANGSWVQMAVDGPPEVWSETASGALNWRLPLGSVSDDLSPVAVRADDAVVVGTSSGDVVVLRDTDGMEVWRTPVGAPVAYPPVILPGDGVAVVTGAGDVVALTSAGVEAFRQPTGVPPQAALTAADDGLIYAPGADGILRTYDATGALASQVDLGGPARVALTTSVVQADGWLFTGRSDGTLLGLASAVTRGRPPDLGNVLRAYRDQDDAVFVWTGAPNACSYRLRKSDDRTSPPTAMVVGQVTVDTLRDVGALLIPPDLEFYRVYGLECCADLQGP